MIKFNRYNTWKLKILIPPYKLDDFDTNLNGGKQVVIYGGYRVYKNLSDNQIYFSFNDRQCRSTILSVSDKEDWPIRKSETYRRIWFSTKKDLLRFKEEMDSRILSEDFIFDPRNRDNFKKMKSKWSYYVVRYD